MRVFSSLRITLVCSLLCFATTSFKDSTDLAGVEDLLWNAASGFAPATSPSDAFRAAMALARLWEDSEGLCHVTELFAVMGLPNCARSTCMRAARAASPAPCAIFCRAHYALWDCDWAVDSWTSDVEAAVDVLLAQNIAPSLGHLEAMLLLDPSRFIHVLQRWAADFRPPSARGVPVRPMAQPTNPPTCRAELGCVRVAMLSSTCREHPHGFALLAALQGLRGGAGGRVATGGRRARVETVCLCKAEREGSDEVTALIQAQCDAWLPWTPSPPSSPVSDQARALALSVNAAAASVLVDLDGWAEPLQIGAVRWKPSPVIFGALGTVGTMAVPEYDHILSDPIVSPPEAAQQYSEALALFPLGRSYFASPLPSSHPDPLRLLARPRSPSSFPSSTLQPGIGPERRDLQLPEQAMVIASLSPSFKLSRRLALLWIAMLKAIAPAVIWLGPLSPIARERVVGSVRALGGGGEEGRRLAERLHFLPGRVHRDQHIAVKELADLAVDPPAYNGHSLTADMLWASVPTMTIPGERPVARVAASILLSEQPEGGEAWARIGSLQVARGDSDLVAIVTRLASLPLADRQALRQAFALQRQGWSVFDVQAWGASFASLLRMATDRWFAAAASQSEAVSQDGPRWHLVSSERAPIH